MRLIEDFRPLPGTAPAVALGNFDGVHLGHRKILSSLAAEAGPAGPLGAVTFTGHTRRRTGERELLTTLPQRLELLERAGVEVCWLVPFDRKLAELSPGRFLEEILLGRLGISLLGVGFNFRFGRDRAGDVEFLRREAEKGGFRLLLVPPVEVAGSRVSSSRIRELVQAGEVGEARSLLGRDHVVSGQVVSGDGLGASLGWPTANFIPEQLAPAPGVYAAAASAAGGPLRPALYYRGTRPTLGEGQSARNEVHILNWRGDLYGRQVKVCLKKRLRGDIKFDSIDKLTQRLKLDGEMAGDVLAEMGLSQEAE